MRKIDMSDVKEAGEFRRPSAGAYICKITDDAGHILQRPAPDGRNAAYQSLAEAISEFGQIENAKYIKMLVEDYDISREAATISNFTAGTNITLTTAPYPREPETENVKYCYRGTPGSVCTIWNSSAGQLFNLDASGATLKLENITLDGRSNRSGTSGVNRLIEVTQGSLVIDSGTTTYRMLHYMKRMLHYSNQRLRHQNPVLKRQPAKDPLHSGISSWTGCLI